MWKEGSGYTVGEEDEQIFSYLSRTGVTTKHMRPECEFSVLTDSSSQSLVVFKFCVNYNGEVPI